MILLIEGEGIYAGSHSIIKHSKLLYDNINKLIFYEWKCFEDVDGFDLEIIQSFSNDFFIHYQNNDTKIKILVTFPIAELECSRGLMIKEISDSLNKMFPNLNEVLPSIGLIITKCDVSISSEHVINRLKSISNPSSCLKQIIDYFEAHSDQIYFFPIPSRSNIGKQYEFDDKNRIIEFCNTSTKVNPETHLTLSDEAKSKLKIIRDDHMEKIRKIIKNILMKKNEEYLGTNNLQIILTWLNVMHILMEQKITKSINFNEIIQKYIPNCREREL